MLFRSVIAATALTGLVSAQNSTTTPNNYTVDIGSLNSTTRQDWCNSQMGTCGLICNQNAYPNHCDPTDLSWQCVCGDGSSHNISDYQNTIPSLECGEWYKQCNAQHAGDLAALDVCQSVKCGKKAAAGAADTSSTASSPAATDSSSATSSMASGTASMTASGSGGAASATKSPGAAAMNVAVNYGTGILTTGLLALFGFAL